MSDKQRVSAARLQKLENNIQQVLDSMNNQVGDLERMLEMLKTQWRGLGAAQFQSLQTEINQRHRNLKNLMGHVQDAVAANRKGSGANDEAIRASLGGIDLNGSKAGDGMIAAGSYQENSHNAQYAQGSKLSAL
ncbi:WXG100 family type VII secretion target [Streptomyces sp. NPDC053560]|uniref:WXG100 family type VII secretion target n=1 Tax=Streptomyces sp. NPDC053560 TaxID=3365711 RepID=UPI0037D63808